MKTQEIINELTGKGFTMQGIKDALCDGEFLSQTDWSESDVEEAHNEICECIDNENDDCGPYQDE